MKNMLLISEVAKRFPISRTALIHYDQINLLKPAFRNDKGYRYYSGRELAKLELILALKESGLTIKEIESFFQGPSNSNSREILIRQKKEIDQKINSLKHQQEVLAHRISLLEEFSTVEIYEGILINNYPSIKIVKETVGYGPLMSYEAAKSRLESKLNSTGHLTSKFGICFDISGMNYTNKSRMKYVFDYLNIADYRDHTTILPKNQYMRCIHFGTYLTVNDSINRLMKYANDHNIILDENAYFVPLLDYWEKTFEHEFASEVLIPIISYAFS